jgi:hypothetical protein
MNTKTVRYELPRPPKRSIKGTCPQCGQRKKLSRYIDTRTGEPLPEELGFGLCDRANNCGYHYSPYHVGPTGISYADAVFEQWKQDNPLPPRSAVRHDQVRTYKGENSPGRVRPKTGFSMKARPPQTVSSPPSLQEPIYSLPDEVFRKTLGHYERNQFARLLREHFGQDKADDLLRRFHVGTCHRPNDYWPQPYATIFWIVDIEGRARGGQVVLFEPDWHRTKYKTRDGRDKAYIDSAKNTLVCRYQQQGKPLPDWLRQYDDNGETWAVPFGLHQLQDPAEQRPVAIVEACKTAVLCSEYLPEFVWLAIGSKSNPNAERLALLKGRKIMLYPDLKAYADWSHRAKVLRAEGFNVSVSPLILDLAQQMPEDADLPDDPDLADILLALSKQPPTPQIVTTLAEWKPGTILRPDPAQLEYL